MSKERNYDDFNNDFDNFDDKQFCERNDDNVNRLEELFYELIDSQCGGGCGGCCRGPRGPRGYRGPKGNKGDDGATGSTISDIYVYNYGCEIVSVGDKVCFDQPSELFGEGKMELVNHDTIKLCDAADYIVEYYLVSGCNKAAVAIFVDGKEVPGSRYSVDGADYRIEGRCQFTVRKHQAPVYVQLRNVGDKAIEVPHGHGHGIVNANIMITEVENGEKKRYDK